MKNEVRTEIEINAPKEAVWKIFADFKNYPNWNPFIQKIDGEIIEGKKFKVFLQNPGGKGMEFKPRCISMVENTEFRWLGHLLFPGLFDGQHIFELKKLDDNKTLFIQREQFKGLLVPLFRNMLETQTKKGFELMNEALKSKAENS